MTVGVRSKRRGWWVGGIAVLSVAGLAWQLLLDGGPAESTPAATVQVKRGDVTVSVAAAGTVQPVAQRELSFAVAGTLTAVHVQPGDQVVPGQVLAAIDPADAEETVHAAEDQLAAAAQALSEAKVAADAAAAAASPNCVPQSNGTTTSPRPSASPAGQSPAPISPAPTVAAPVSQSTMPAASDSRAPATCPSTGKGNAGSTTGRGVDAIYSAEVSVNQANLTLTQARRKLAGTTITAPVAGRVLSVGGKAGSAVGTSAFITLGVVAQMMVQAQFAEADAVTLAVGQPATVTLANQKGKTFPVTVTQVAAVGTVADKLVRYTVLLTFDQRDDGLLIGQSATATVVLNRSVNVRYLPQSAVRVIGDGTGEVKVAGGVRQVTIGLRGDGNVEILDGLNENDAVALNARS